MSNLLKNLNFDIYPGEAEGDIGGSALEDIANKMDINSLDDEDIVFALIPKPGYAINNLEPGYTLVAHCEKYKRPDYIYVIDPGYTKYNQADGIERCKQNGTDYNPEDWLEYSWMIYNPYEGTEKEKQYLKDCLKKIIKKQYIFIDSLSIDSHVYKKLSTVEKTPYYKEVISNCKILNDMPLDELAEVYSSYWKQPI